MYKLGAENHMLRMRPETCRAKETSINYIVASSWYFTLFHDEDARANNPQNTKKNCAPGWLYLQD